MKKCDPRAFARCPGKKFCKNIEDAEFKEGSDCDKFNQSILVHPPTNADRIRGMSDSDLAWELMVWRCEAVARHHGIESEFPDTQATILEWLKKPVEGV